MIALAPTPFEQWAAREGYDITPAVLPGADRVYADRQTEAVFEAWNAGRQCAFDSVSKDADEEIQRLEAIIAENPR